MPSYTWLDESIDHSDSDAAKCNAIANRISVIQSDREQRARQADYEDGRNYDPFEDCECDYCISRNHDCNQLGTNAACSLCEHPTVLTECETVRTQCIDIENATAAIELELEWLHEQLAKLGARIVRPYEHWNEDERYMEYMERDRD